MFYRNSNFYLTSKENISTANIPRPSSIYQTILAQIHRQQNFWKYFRLCDAGFYRFSLWYANLSIRKLEAWVNLTKHVAFSDFSHNPLNPAFLSQWRRIRGTELFFRLLLRKIDPKEGSKKMMTSFSPNNLGTQDRQVYAKPALPVFSALHPLQ